MGKCTIAASSLANCARHRRKGKPKYYFEVIRKTNKGHREISYKCTVKLKSVKAVGYGESRNIARENSAKEAMIKLRCFDTDPDQVARAYDYKGALNKMTDRLGISKAVYSNVPNPESVLKYGARCYLLCYVTVGYGISQSCSEHDAARIMTEELVELGVFPIVNEAFANRSM